MFQLLLYTHLLFHPPVNKQLDSFYLRWMQTTIQTLEHRAKYAAISLKQDYLNKLPFFKDGIPIDTLYPRYLLLKDQFQKISACKGEVVIIEVIINASALVFSDIVIYKNDKRVEEYRLGPYRKWSLKGACIYDQDFLQEELNKYYLENRDGINNEQVTITKIASGKLIASAHFISRSLSVTSGLQPLFDILYDGL